MRLPATLPLRRLAYVASVVLAAFASGHFVQTSVGPAAPPALALAAPPVVTTAPPEPAQPPAPTTATCDRAVTVEPGLAGMLRVVLTAPCSPGATVSVAQAALGADWTLDASGMKHLSFTPMSPDHPLVVTWPDGTRTARQLPEPQEDAPFRVALAWSGPRLFSLTVQEFGSAPGVGGFLATEAAGHFPSRDGSGFLTVLGDGTGRMAEVYTFPHPAARHEGVVRLSVSAPITFRTCGRQAQATALQADPFGGLMTSRVDIALPDCEAIGQTLVLRNLFRDLRLAAH